MSPFSVRRFRSLVPLSGPGGDERVRTDDPLLAKQVLSQLSYTPMHRVGLNRTLRLAFESLCRPSKLNSSQAKPV